MSWAGSAASSRASTIAVNGRPDAVARASRAVMSSPIVPARMLGGGGEPGLDLVVGQAAGVDGHVDRTDRGDRCGVVAGSRRSGRWGGVRGGSGRR